MTYIVLQCKRDGKIFQRLILEPFWRENPHPSFYFTPLDTSVIKLGEVQIVDNDDLLIPAYSWVAEL
jgi:hypothetical protein